MVALPVVPGLERDERVFELCGRCTMQLLYEYLVARITERQSVEQMERTDCDHSDHLAFPLPHGQLPSRCQQS